MIGKAIAYGAISIVNAIAGGRGVTLGIELFTKSTVNLSQEMRGWIVRINGRDEHKGRLAIESAKEAIVFAGLDPDKFGGSIETESNIPIGKGLKSSSSASISIFLSTLAALGFGKVKIEEILQCVTNASLRSGTSITGAFDDSASCLLGGLNYTDNFRRKLIAHRELEKRYTVVIRVPKEESKRGILDMDLIKKISNTVSYIFDLSMRTNPWDAMTLNGLLYGTIMGYNTKAAFEALEHGALGAGISGTGPAIAAVFNEDDKENVIELSRLWSNDEGEVIVTRTNNECAKVIMYE